MILAEMIGYHFPTECLRKVR